MPKLLLNALNIMIKIYVQRYDLNIIHLNIIINMS